MRTAFAILRTALLCSLLGGLALPAVAQGTEIRNVASVSFEDNGTAVTVASNAAVLGRVEYHLFRAWGYVFNARTGEPVNGVEVQLMTEAGEMVQSTISGPPQEKRSASVRALSVAPVGNGEFRFSQVKQGF